MKKAVILLSGGLDSATVAAIAKNQGYELYALSFDYGQRHKIELEAAKQIANFFDFKEHKIAKIDLRLFGGSALTDDFDVPKRGKGTNDDVPCSPCLGGVSSCDSRAMGVNNSIPITYVPARNTIFLSYALGYAEVIGAGDIFIGVNQVDYSGYPDCRQNFIDAFEKMANLATAKAVGDKNHLSEKLQIKTPLIDLTKAQIIKVGLDLGVNYAITHSCYDPIIKNEEVFACGHCDSCQFRLKGFEENEISDPREYF
jgi:7-cyano-7-deazaguanine synthase